MEIEYNKIKYSTGYSLCLCPSTICIREGAVRETLRIQGVEKSELANNRKHIIITGSYLQMDSLFDPEFNNSRQLTWRASLERVFSMFSGRLRL